MEFVEKQVENDKKVWIARKVEAKNGVDYYMSSNKFLRQLGKRLKRSFKGELKESRKLFSRNRKTSKAN